MPLTDDEIRLLCNSQLRLTDYDRAVMDIEFMTAADIERIDQIISLPWIWRGDGSDPPQSQIRTLEIWAIYLEPNLAALRLLSKIDSLRDVTVYGDPYGNPLAPLTASAVNDIGNILRSLTKINYLSFQFMPNWHQIIRHEPTFFSKIPMFNFQVTSAKWLGEVEASVLHPSSILFGYMTEMPARFTFDRSKLERILFSNMAVAESLILSLSGAPLSVIQFAQCTMPKLIEDRARQLFPDATVTVE